MKVIIIILCPDQRKWSCSPKNKSRFIHPCMVVYTYTTTLDPMHEACMVEAQYTYITYYGI